MNNPYTNPRKRKVAVAVCLLGALLFSSSAMAAEGGGWDWMVAPYGWAASIGTDLKTTTPPSSASNDSDFSDIVSKIDGVLQLHAEGKGDHFGILADFTYLGLADDDSRARFHTETDLDTRLFELAAVWSPDSDRRRGLDVIGGLRYIDIDLTAQLRPDNTAFSPVKVDAGQSFSDFMLGARYTWAPSDRWGITLRGDGSWGDTEGTWNTSLTAQYRAGPGAVLFGYRYLDVEVEAGNSNTHITMHGPQVGYAFQF